MKPSKRGGAWRREEDLIESLDSVVKEFERVFGKPSAEEIEKLRATSGNVEFVDNVRDLFPGHKVRTAGKPGRNRKK